MELTKRISDKVETLLNKRVQGEWLSAQLYEGMSNWCDCYGFYKAKDKYRKYADEEREHAKKLTDYIIDRNGTTKLQAIEAIPFEYKSLLDVINKSYEHECKVSDDYKLLMKQLCDEEDITTKEFIRWFVKEQIEEESKFADAIILANRLGITDATTGIELFKLEDYVAG